MRTRFPFPPFASAFVVIAIATIASGDARTDARELFRAGMALVASGQLDAGISKLEAAYETLPHPHVLFNIARAYADAGRYEDSVEYFDRYVESDPPDRSEVELFLAALRARLVQATEPPAAVTTARDADELAALEEAADQLATLAEAVHSEELRDRATRLRSLLEQLRSERSGDGNAANDANAEPGVASTVVPPAVSVQVPRGLPGGTDDDTLYEERVVSASRHSEATLDAPNATYIITRQDIRLSGLTSIPELLRRVPGADVMTTTPADVNLSFRGFNERNSPRTLVLIDGRTVYADPIGATFWNTLTIGVEDIERIEVVRGPASALYGADAFSGIVNIITRAPGEEREATRVSVSGGNASQIRGHFSTSGRHGRLAHRATFGYDQADDYTRRLATSRADLVDARSRLALRSLRANANLRYRLGDQVTANVQSGVNRGNSRFLGSGGLDEVDLAGVSGFAQVGLATPWGSLRAFWNGLYSDFSSYHPDEGQGDPFSARVRWNTFDIEAELAREFHFLVDHNLHLGAGYRLKHIDWNYLSDDQLEHHFNVFFQDTLRLHRAVSIVASARADFHPLLNRPVVSPRGAIVLRTSSKSALRISGGSAFRTQTFLESYLALPFRSAPGLELLGSGSETAASLLGSPRLRPEQIVSAEVGYRNADLGLAEIALSIYYNRVTNLVSFDLPRMRRFNETDGAYNDATGRLNLGYALYRNEAATYDVGGGEVEVRAYPIRGLDLYANYALNLTVASDLGPTVSSRADQTSPHKLNFGIQMRSDIGLDISIDFHWVASQTWVVDFVRPDLGAVKLSMPVQAQHLVNARLGYRFLDDQIEIGITGFNVTRQRVRQHPFAQTLDTRVLATLSYHLR